MKKISILGGMIAALSAWSVGSMEPTAASQPQPPNIVFIAIDDLNDWVGCLGGHPDARTPHIDALAARGILFRNAHCQVPVCMASRVSVFSGRLAATTGCYEFNAEFHQAPTLADCLPIPLYFKQHGYRTLGGGKLLHSGFQGRLAETFDVHWKTDHNPSPAAKMNWPVKVWDFGPYPAEDEAMGDYQLASQAAEFLRQPADQPFFVATGFHRPHVPMHVPGRWFELFDRESIALPKAPLEDLADIPESDITRQKAIAPSHAEVLRSGKWRDLVQAYLASSSFVDHCVGAITRAVLEGPHADNTIIVLWSDHGFHLGEKQHWAKRTLWSESTRVPLIFAGKGIRPGLTTEAAVSLIDVYPTLTSLAGLAFPPGVEGRDLVPLMHAPDQAWSRGVVSTWLPNNHAVVDRHWRYIHYADGAEELYDHRQDPDEFTNLANDPAFASIKQDLARWLPKHNTPLLKVAGGKRGE
jgi:choline-sulfatase